MIMLMVNSEYKFVSRNNRSNWLAKSTRVAVIERKLIRIELLHLNNSNKNHSISIYLYN